MKLPARTPAKIGFANLKQQFDAWVRHTPTPPDEIGQLPASQLGQIKRKTLHLHGSTKEKDAQVAA